MSNTVHTLLMVVFVLVAIAMIVLILLQRGAGAQAGSGFGSGASGTVFGSRGSANFLSSSTKWLAGVFFALSLFMAWQSSRDARAPVDAAATKTDLGVMADLPAGAETGKPVAPVLAPPPALPAPESAAPVTPGPVIAPAPAAATPAVKSPASAPQQAPVENKGG
ncbi:MAG: preprotein translocase subunit SecG [Arenimonas sp.]